MRRLLSLVSLMMVALPAGAQNPATQTIGLFSYGYDPSSIALHAGAPITITFVNRSGKSHDFTAPEFFAAARIVAGDVKDGEVDIAKGESKAVTLVPAAGKYKVHCSRPFHEMSGMKAEIIVR